MKKVSNLFILLTLITLSGFGMRCSSAEPLRIQVKVGGHPLDVYHHHGKCYIEAQKGKEYTISLTNNSSRRIAVALSVDGLNSIDAKHVSPSKSSKWVIGPWRTVNITGWQVNRNKAKKFYFTTEDDSYGAALGQTKNLGIISAVVFREKVRCQEKEIQTPPLCNAGSADSRKSKSQARIESECSRALNDDYAATGMGRAVDNRVRRVKLELEPRPCQVVNYRYEFRPVLVRLGVIPPDKDPLWRREHAHGFASDSFCPEIRK